MDTYVVLVVDDDEDRWETLDPVQRQDRYGADARVVAMLEDRGGKVVGGAELTHSRRTRVVGAQGVTDGPYAESVEQLSGFYVVECGSLDDLTEAARQMSDAHHHLEIRPCPGRTD
jgi:hypothetical protein